MSIIYDEQTRALAFADVAQDILRGAQNELYLNMRFLDVALSSLAFLPDSQIRTAGTDGSVFYFQPDQLTVVFRKGRELVNRLYLHSILHCLFAHLWVKGDRDEKYWNLACDIAVEYVIDHLYIRAVHHPMSALRREFYRTVSDAANAPRNTNLTSFSPNEQPVRSVGQTGAFSDALAQSQAVSENHSTFDSLDVKATGASHPALTAQRIYRYLCQVHLVDSQIDQLQREFAVDDHSRWAANADSDDAHQAPTPQSDFSSASQDQKPDESSPKKQPENSDSDAEKHWEDIRDRMQTEMEIFGKDASDEYKALEEQVGAANRKRYDYRDFLRKFSVLKEEMQVDTDSFDYIYYNYGMEMYGNMPLIEPLETKEVKKIEDFVIVLDTSMSCEGELLLHFLEETYNILNESESFFRKIHIHILQCDDRVQEDVLVTSREEMQDYLEHFTVRGFGGTDFRPPFARVQELMRRQCFTKLRGLIYFTDGYGIFPVKKPPYDTAFVFLREDYCDVDVPPWAIKLIVDREEFERISPEK